MKELTLKGNPISSNTKKDGTPLIGKFGPYYIIKFETVEEGWVSMFGKKPSELKAGDKITGTLDVKESNGFTNKNFTPAKKEDELIDRIAKLEGRVMRLELSFERKFEELAIKVKGDVVLETTGKFLTDKDYAEFSKPHPLLSEDNNIPF